MIVYVERNAVGDIVGEFASPQYDITGSKLRHDVETIEDHHPDVIRWRELSSRRVRPAGETITKSPDSKGPIRV